MPQYNGSVTIRETSTFQNSIQSSATSFRPNNQ